MYLFFAFRMDIPSQRRCFPSCKIPEKRDFMDVNPEKSEDDFYKEYDPMVGLGTAAILIVFFIVITVKSFIRWIIRKYKLFKFKRAAKKLSILQTTNNLLYNSNNNAANNNNNNSNYENFNHNNDTIEVNIIGKRGGGGEILLNGKISSMGT
jgi:hypothetical protein|uniref:Uncharacterized protein n=1 Tax=Panagrolaimus sp. PS1159 TaxID=55785 RepID=A0AC35GJC1_9BILA